MRPALFTSLIVLMSGPILASAADGLPSQLNIQDFPGLMIDDVVVPNAGEVFTLMDKLGKPNWASHVRRELGGEPSTDRAELALRFGTLIADGFIAVQAKDTDAVKELGRQILDLAESLSLRQAVVPHTQAILEACDRRDWQAVRQELDRTHTTVRDTMERMRDEELAQCVSVAGWVRGTEVLTSLVREAYSKDKAEILHQPDLAAHFIAKLENMPPDLLDKAPVREILAGLKQIRALMDTSGEKPLSADTISKIHRITSEIGLPQVSKPQ